MGEARESERGGGPPAGRGGVDPATALSIAEAARLAGVSRSTIQRRIAEGSLLHEVGRRGGRDSVIVRFVDLADAFPGLVGAERPSSPPAVPPDDPPRAKAPRSGELAVRVEGLVSANDSLGAQVEDLKLQRRELVAQLDDLRGRLTVADKERQASTAGVLRAQERLLELEGAAPPPPASWWRRTSTWGFAVSLGVLGWIAREEAVRADELSDRLTTENKQSMADRSALSLAVERQRSLASKLESELDDERDAAARERARIEAELDSTRSERQAFGLELEAARAERDRFERSLETVDGERERIADELAAERTFAAEERERTGRELERAHSASDAVVVALAEERAAAREERERFALELDARGQEERAALADADARIDELVRAVEAAHGATEALRLELARSAAAPPTPRSNLDTLRQWFSERVQDFRRSAVEGASDRRSDGDGEPDD